ncbi:hypothetical protein [Allomesorhizobium alhagi]|uniref:Transmembrane protein n=1 Tax=Mesorhizobium alhagi CCNWXJ12-2 TaxID=1107882 RepID=H0HNF7_9HYPH|nr:hypothetical protein [Mesorhizobium alhagi]EHK57729.1 hypothetical protein MAXJ12_08399 [Mesorhizobium alhagi CCNWXJ12-2]
MDTNKAAVMALCSCLFGCIGLVAMIAFGGDTARYLATGSAFFACASQFVGQTGGRRSGLVSVGLAYTGFALALGALIKF